MDSTMIGATSRRVPSSILVLLATCLFRLNMAAVQKGVFGSANIGPKIAQELEIRFTGASINYANPQYIGKDAYARIIQASKDDPPALYAYMLFLRDWPMDVNSTFTAYQKVNRKWRETIVKGVLPLCDALESKVLYYRRFLDYTSFPHKCPVRKGNFTIDKFGLNNDEMPKVPFAASNQMWKVKVGFKTKDTPIFFLSFEFRLDPKGSSRSVIASLPHL